METWVEVERNVSHLLVAADEHLWPKGHYLALVLTVGKNDFERVFFPLVSVDETADEALGRWLDVMMEGRVRNRAKAADKLRARIEQMRIARPTSYYRAGLADDEPTPIPGKRTRARRRR